MKRTVSGIMLTLLLIGMLTLAFNIRPVKASGTIYIRADGSIDPPDAPISSVDNVTYTFIDNIYSEIVIERDNIVVEGASYTVQFLLGKAGIELDGRRNVTIKNVEIKGFITGISLYYSSDNSIYRNNVTSNINGMELISSRNNSIFQNDISENSIGILLGDSSVNSIFANSIANNHYAIEAYSMIEVSNTIYHNNFINNPIGSISNIEYIWDDGYPSGGNYWSDYTGVDKYSGPNQDELSNDGIGDTPYIIDADNQDNYPLTKPYGGPHDIGITDVTPSKTVVGQGYDLHVNVTIINYGIQTETFNVTVYMNNLAMPTEDDKEDAWLAEKTINSIYAVDEDWNTYVKGNTSELGWRAYVYENFTVPPVVGGAKWTGKYLTTFSSDWGSSNVDVYCYDYNSESWTQILSTYATSYEDAIKNWTVTIPDNCLNKTLMVKTELRKRDPFCVGFCSTDWYFEGKVSWLYTNISLPSRKSTTIAFTWDTTGFAKGNYTISAYVTPVPGETDLMDNNFTDGTIAVTILGDLNNDCVVDIADVVLVTAIYRSKCGEPDFRPNSDIIEDCVIDIADVVSVTSHYRETW